jgi:hypothetical protein
MGFLENVLVIWMRNPSYHLRHDGRQIVKAKDYHGGPEIGGLLSAS